MKAILINMLLSILLLIAGYFFFGLFMEFSIFLLKGITVITSQVGEDFQSRIIFSIAFGITPWLSWGAGKIGKSKDWKQHLFIWLSIAISGGIFWYLRVLSLQEQHADLVKANPISHVRYVFSMNILQFEVNLLIGFVTGAILSAIILNRTNRNLPANPFRKNASFKK